MLFLSTPSARRATPPARWIRRSSRYFYPRPPRGGRLSLLQSGNTTVLISIHALREEGDAVMCLCCNVRQRFLSTPSARRATFGIPTGVSGLKVFLSTPSARRATLEQKHVHIQRNNFYPRPPRGGRLYLQAMADPDKIAFLSTPSARRATLGVGHQGRDQFQFLSTPSARRATGQQTNSDTPIGISIHALREEGDTAKGGLKNDVVHFYPRPPRGGRHFCKRKSPPSILFLSTPSARRATWTSSTTFTA